MLGRVAVRHTQSLYRTASRSCSFFTLPCDSAPPTQDTQLAAKSFEADVLKKLNAPLDNDLIEIKPDGILYFPEIRYRRILNNSFGQGGWALVPRGNPVIRGSTMIREYAMYVNGNFVSQAIGDQTMSYGMSEATAIESAKSTALMRCCKDLGIGNELWDPTFIQQWKEDFAEKVWCVNEKSNEKRMLWRRKDRSFIQFPWVEQNAVTRSKPAARTLPKEPAQDYSASSSSPTPPAPPPPPQFTPPPPPSAPSGGATSTSAPPPPPPPQFTPPPAAPAPNKVFKGTVDVDMSEQVPSSITDGSPFEGKTWEEVASDTEGRNFLSRVCAKPSLDMNQRAQIAEVLRRHILNVRNQSKE